MGKKKYDNLVKPLKLKEGPRGLYPYPLFWMEGKDMEGFNATFSYSFVTEPGVCHPVKGMVVHPYDELLVFGGLREDPEDVPYLGQEPRDILYLGGEVSIEIGDDREEYIFNEPTVVTIPKGVPHGPIKFRRVTVPFAHYTIGLSPEYQATEVSVDGNAPKSLDTKYAHLVKRLITHVDEELINMGLGYEKCTDERGVFMYGLAPRDILGPGNADELVWMFGKDLERFEINFTWGHYSKPGLWHTGGETHLHPEEEILIFVGLDPKNPESLGAEQEIALGLETERYVFSTPTTVVCPKGFPHLPLVTRWCDKPYGFVVACLSGEHASPWVEAK